MSVAFLSIGYYIGQTRDEEFGMTNDAKALKVLEALQAERRTLMIEGKGDAAAAIEEFIVEANRETLARLYDIIVAA
jgi:hypothetical protein